MSIKGERWRWAHGYEGLYMVSDEGRVMSAPRAALRGPTCGRILSQTYSRSGYLGVSLFVKGHAKRQQVHRLVAEAFVPNPEHKPQVNHIDGNKANNVVSNLEWVTASENALHSYRNLPRKKFSHFHSVKLTPEQAKEIRASEGTAASVAKRFGVSDVTVLKIRKGQSWKEEQCL